jgi:hypothetical protein
MLSLVSRRCAQKTSVVARAGAAVTHPQGEALKANTFIPPACKIFAGEMPTHYVPAQDSPKDKMWSRYQHNLSSSMSSDYGPGKYNYGRCGGQEHRVKRFFTHFLGEPVYLKLKAREYGLWALFLAPMMIMSSSTRKREAEGKKNPQPMSQGAFGGIARWAYSYHHN